MNEELWKDIPGLEGKYQASNLGRIRSVRLLKEVIATDTGYLVVSVTGPQRFHVHTLVARTFIGPRPEGKQVNHIDGNRRNNAEENLEYVTPRENSHHSFTIANRKHYFTEKQMDKISIWFFEEGLSVSGICRKLLPKNHDIHEFRRMRKKVRSVIGIWRAADRPVGHKNPYERKLTPERADHMRKLRAAGAKQSELAELFHCHPAHVSRVCAGLMWNKDQAH